MTVLGNVAATAANIGSLDSSSGPSSTNSEIAVPSKTKVDRATRNKPGGSKVGGNRTSPRKKASQPAQSTAIVKEVRKNDHLVHPMVKTRSANKIS